jgi:single-strand DNA-binding protein
MPAAYNRVVLVGNLTRDPEIAYTSGSGKAVAKLTLAVDNPRNGEKTLFADCIAWERPRETCNRYLTKGASALVEGRLVIRAYAAKGGTKRKATEIVLDRMQMLGAPRGGEDEAADDDAEPVRASRHAPTDDDASAVPAPHDPAPRARRRVARRDRRRSGAPAEPRRDDEADSLDSEVPF